MSDTPNNTTNAPYDEEVDDDLIALSPPPPSARLMLFTSAILILSIVMLGWFVPELRFFLAQFGGAKDLGEAADIDVGALRSHSFVTVDGFPLVQRTLAFKEGVKWFMLSDNMRKFFPLAGQPHLFVQWAETDAYKAYRDPDSNPGVMGPPSHFKGHLVSREDLGKNYDRVFVFYDCLKNHYLGRCNLCLGKSTMEACRDTFVCAENNDKEMCETLLSRPAADIDQDIDAAKQAGDAKKRQSLEALRAAKQAHDVSVRSVRLEELITQADRLEDAARDTPSADRETILKIQKQLLVMRTKELEIRATNAFRTVGSLGKEKIQAIRTAATRLPGLEKSVQAHTETLKLMNILIDIGDELDRLKKRCLDLKKKAVLLSPEEIAALADFDPADKKGTEINTAIAALESAVAEKERARYQTFLATTAADKDPSQHNTPDADGDDVPDAGAAEPPRPPSPPLPEVSKALAADVSYQKLMNNLDAVARRAVTLVNKIRVLMPGMIPAFDKWAAKPDVLGVIPEGLREVRVIGALGDLERMLLSASIPEGEDATLLAAAYNSRIDQLNAAKKELKAIESMPGIREVRIVDKLTAIKNAIQKNGNASGSFRQEIDALVAEMMSAGLYLSNLKGAPEETAGLSRLLAPEQLEAAAQQLDTVEAGLSPGDWVLIDGEIPMDKLWVPAVYLMLLIMIFVNLRKLWRFYLAYKE